MFDRMVRAALLQPQAYEEAKRGGGGVTLEALLVVAITGVLAGLGGGFRSACFARGFSARPSPTLLAGCCGWW